MAITHLSTYRIGLVQAQAYRMLQQHFRAGLEPFHITIPEWSLLGVVFDGGQLSLTEITHILKSKASHPTVLVETLVERGLLDRQVHPKDKRTKVVTVTAAGKKLIPQIEASVRASIRSAIQHVPRPELEVYYRVLAMFAASVTPDGE